MTKLQLSLPEGLGEFVRGLVAGGHYPTADAYFEELIDQDRERRRLAEVRDEIDRRLTEALHNGDPVAVTPAYWERLREEARERLASRQDSR